MILNIFKENYKMRPIQIIDSYDFLSEKYFERQPRQYQNQRWSSEDKDNQILASKVDDNFVYNFDL